MENAEEVLQSLEEFTKRRPKIIPRELEEYLHFVARTGDPVYQWALVKNLFKEKLLNVITEFYETSPGLDIPHCPNVDVFNYETMKNSLLEKIDAFSAAPFTVQRICELLTSPRKQYTRIDKFMRAFEKNILVVSTREPGPLRHSESENGEAAESMVNGSDSNSDYNVDVDMEDMSWKENADPLQSYAVQSSSRSVSSEPFARQNGPLEGHNAQQVELMSVEQDNSASPAAESSASDSSLSPPEITSPSEENAQLEHTDEPVSSVEAVSPVDASENIEATEKIEEPVEKAPVESSEDGPVESLEDGEIVIAFDKSENKVENVSDKITSVNVGALEEESISKDEMETLPLTEEVEHKKEEPVASTVEESKVDSTDVDQLPPAFSPSTDSQENVSEPEPMESQTEINGATFIPEDNDNANSAEMDTLPAEVLPILEPSVIITEESVTLKIDEPTEPETKAEPVLAKSEKPSPVIVQIEENSSSQDSSGEDKEVSSATEQEEDSPPAVVMETEPEVKPVPDASPPTDIAIKEITDEEKEPEENKTILESTEEMVVEPIGDVVEEKRSESPSSVVAISGDSGDNGVEETNLSESAS